MTLVDHLRLLRRRWWLVLIAAVLGVAVAAGTNAVSAPVYASSTQLFVSVRGTSTSTAVEVGQGSAAAQQKVRSYTDVVTSSRVLEPVLRRLDLPYSTSELARAVTATVGSNSVVLTITVRDSDPERAAAVAEAVSESFREVVVDSLEASPDGGPGLVSIEVLEPPVASASPVSPNTRLNLAIGMAGGAAAGYLAALLRLLLDTKVRTRADVETLGDLPMLGHVLRDPDATERPLTVQLDPRGPRAEAFRTLRTSIQFADAGSTTRVIVMTSAMPGEGKTTTTANLAITMAESGARVALVDADLRRPRLADVLGLEGAVGLTDVLIGRAALADVTQPWGRGTLDVVPAGQVPPNASELLGSARMHELVDDLRARYDYVLLDAPPVLPVTDAAVLSRIVDGAIVAAAVGKTTKARFAEAVETLHRIGSRVVGVTLTMQPVGRSGAYDTPYVYYTTPADQSPVTGTVPSVPTPPARRSLGRHSNR